MPTDRNEGELEQGALPGEGEKRANDAASEKPQTESPIEQVPPAPSTTPEDAKASEAPNTREEELEARDNLRDGLIDRATGEQE